MMCYIVILFALGTIGLGADLKFTEMAYVDDRDFPGGPYAFFVEENGITINKLVYGAYIANMWLADAIVVCIFRL